MSTENSINVIYIEKNCIKDFKHFYKVSHERWNNAVNCYKSGDYLAAVYLAGYSVENILKYILLKSLFEDILNADKCFNIGQLIKSDNFYEPLKTHKLSKLLEIGHQTNTFKIPKDSDFQEVMKWTSEWRYAFEYNLDDQKTKAFLESVKQINQQLKTELEGKIKLKELDFGGDVFNDCDKDRNRGDS